MAKISNRLVFIGAKIHVIGGQKYSSKLVLDFLNCVCMHNTAFILHSYPNKWQHHCVTNMVKICLVV